MLSLYCAVNSPNYSNYKTSPDYKAVDLAQSGASGRIKVVVSTDFPNDSQVKHMKEIVPQLELVQVNMEPSQFSAKSC